MKAEIGIVTFFLVVGLMSAWFHWYFVAPYRFRNGVVLEAGKTYKITMWGHEEEIYFDDVTLRRVYPFGILGKDILKHPNLHDDQAWFDGEIDWKPYGTNIIIDPDGQQRPY